MARLPGRVPLEAGRADAEHPLERPRKLILVSKSEVRRHLFDKQPLAPGLPAGQKVGGEVHPLPLQVLIRTRRIEPPKEAAGIRRRDLKKTGGLGDAPKPRALGGEKRPEPLVSVEYPGIDVIGTQAAFGDLREQHAEQLATEGGRVRGMCQTALLEEVEDLADLLGLWHAEHAARGDPGRLHTGGGGGADEIDVVLSQPMPGVGADGMRDAGAVGKNTPRHEVVVAALEREGAAAGDDELDAEVGKVVPLQKIVAANPLAATADDRQIGPTAGAAHRPEVQKPAAGRHHLTRHEFRQPPA